MLAANGSVRVIDFGIAAVLAKGKTFTMCGTPDYMAPEIVRRPETQPEARLDCCCCCCCCCLAG